MAELAIEQHKEKLRARYPGVGACEVTVEDRPPHNYERRRFNVRLDIDYSGRHLVVNREHENDPAVALAQAFDAAHWQLEAVEASSHLR